MVHRNESEIPTETFRKADGWSRDKARFIAWAGGLIGCGILSWGVWSTVAVFSLQSSTALVAAEIKANETQSRERDKVIAEAAAERAAAIQLQLAQIQAQLAEIQRDLRHGASRP